MTLNIATMTADARIQFATPLQREAHERRKRFRERLAAMVGASEKRPALLQFNPALAEPPSSPAPLPAVEEFVDALTKQLRDTYAQLDKIERALGRCPIIAIQRATADFYDVTVMEMVSARRMASIVKPRMVAIYLARILTTHSLPEIGRRFGGRDHTTILHSVRKITTGIAVDAGLAADVAAISAVLRPSPRILCR